MKTRTAFKKKNAVKKHVNHAADYHKADSVDFLHLGAKMIKLKVTGSEEIRHRRFASWFGLDPPMCAHLWERLESSSRNPADPKAGPVHLFSHPSLHI